MLEIKDIESAVLDAAGMYGIRKAELFGSYASGAQRDRSDVDLIVEFDESGVSLVKLSELRLHLEDILGVDVDIVHGPISEDALIEAEDRVALYAA